MRIRSKHYASGALIEVESQEGLITSVTSPSARPVDLEAAWLAPALFDLQINGCLGIDFCSRELQIDHVRAVVDACRGHGIGGFLATLITGSFDTIAHGLRTLVRARQSDPLIAATVPGYHLEGPFISPEEGPRGAHPVEYVREPNWDEFRRWQDIAAGAILLVTLAPEREGALGMIEKLVRSGVTAAIGHTAASCEQVRAAVSAGARLSTHLGNAAHRIVPRHDNYIWEQLGADELSASIICDGHHLPASVVKCMVRAKTPARIVLTCDASSLAGLPPGQYGRWEVMSDGRVVVSGTPFLAGSGWFTDTCIRGVMRMAGVSFAEAVDMATVRPCQLLGLPAPRLAVGEPAKLMVCNEEYEQMTVI